MDSLLGFRVCDWASNLYDTINRAFFSGLAAPVPELSTLALATLGTVVWPARRRLSMPSKATA